MIKTVFAPGCALMLHNPEVAKKIQVLLKEQLGITEVHDICCHHEPQFSEPTRVVNICPGCDKRYSSDYKNSSTISLWELLAESNWIALPNYHGQKMSILDACPTRENENLQLAIRKLLSAMNIHVVEPTKTRSKSTCCGDSFYGIISTDKVVEQMEKRALEMPEENVVVYCISCIKSMYVGGKKPRHILDLIFELDTVPKTYNPDEWHRELDIYIDSH